MSHAPGGEAAPTLAGDGNGTEIDTNYPHLTTLLIDSKKAAEELRMSKRKLWSLTKCGAIPSRKIDTLVRYSPAELQGWVDAGCPTAPGSGAAIRSGGRA